MDSAEELHDSFIKDAQEREEAKWRKALQALSSPTGQPPDRAAFGGRQGASGQQPHLGFIHSGSRRTAFVQGRPV